ncbi:MAG: SH3 domain-containing protein, partial [Nitrospina sp.]|nr:SH3 domain-containing protein [Nitrospina sp.]
MTSLFRYILSAILALSLIQSSYARTSTENLIVEESDILGIQKQETAIEEDSFSEEVQTQKRDYAWIVNVKKGPFLTEKKAKQAAFDLNKIINRTIPELKNKVSINWELTLPKNKKISQDKLSWMVNLKFGIYNSKNIALRAVQKIKPTQRIPENVFITRELKDSNVSNLIETTDSKISGKIFFSRELLPEKNKTKEFILVTTNSNSLNVRKNPSSSSSVIGKLPKGSKVPHIKNDNSKKRNGNWFYVEYSKGKFGWVSSSYTRKIVDVGDSLSIQAKLKISKIKEKPIISQFEKIKPLATVLQSELDIIKADKAKAIQATNQAKTKAKEEKLASIKEFKNLKDKSSKQIEILLTKTDSLQSELNQIKIDKAKSTQATNQANTKAKEEKLASIKEFENLKDKSSKEIQDLKITTNSLQSQLNQLKSDKAKAIKATNQAKTRAKEERLASIKEFENLKAKNSEQIKSLQTTTASLRLELDKATNEKIKAIKATNLSNTKAKEERLSSISKYQGLKVRSSKEIEDLKTKTDSLTTKLNKTRIEKTKIIESRNQANLRAKEEKIVFTRENNTLKQKISSLRVVLEKFKIEKEKNTQLTNEIKAKTKKESFASIKEFKKLKVKNLKEIQDLKTINASLQSELNKVKTDKAKTIVANNQVILMAKEEKNLLEKKIRSLRVVLDKFKVNKEKDNQLTNQANTKAKDERLASISKYNNLKEKKSEEIKNLKTITASLRSELDKVETDKAKAIETAGQASAQIQTERLKNAKLMASLEIKNEKEISNLKEIFDLKIFITSLQSELKKIQVEKDVVINAFNETSAELKTTNSDNLKFTNKLKDTVLFLRKELDNLKVESDKNKREEKIVSSNETDLIKEASRKKILTLKNTVISLRSKLDKDKANKTNKLTTIDQANIKENKKLNSTIKNLRTVLETFKNKKLKTDEATKALNLKLGAERILKDKEISALKKETIVLKLKLDKANLDRVKAIGRINQRIKKPTTGLIPKKEIIDQPSKKQG